MTLAARIHGTSHRPALGGQHRRAVDDGSPRCGWVAVERTQRVDVEEIAIAPQGVEVGEGIKAGALSRRALIVKLARHPSNSRRRRRAELSRSASCQRCVRGVYRREGCTNLPGSSAASSHVKGEVT